MKNLKILFVALCIAGFATAQKGGGIGLKAGTNYGTAGDLIVSGQSIVDNPESNFGYHAGLFGKIDFDGFYIRPELVYTSLNSDYDGSALEIQKLDAPVLLGLRLIGPLHVFAGPSFQYILSTELEDIDLDSVQENFTIGMQAGIGVNLGNFGMDLRYENGLTENQAEFTNLSSIGSLDTRPQQIILSLSFKL